MTVTLEALPRQTDSFAGKTDEVRMTLVLDELAIIAMIYLT